SQRVIVPLVADRWIPRRWSSAYRLQLFERRVRAARSQSVAAANTGPDATRNGNALRAIRGGGWQLDPAFEGPVAARDRAGPRCADGRYPRDERTDECIEQVVFGFAGPPGSRCEGLSGQMPVRSWTSRSVA